MRITIPTLLACTVVAHASSLIPLTEEETCRAADAVCRGTVKAVRCVEGPSGRPITRTWITVEETFRGRLPEVICVESRGGSLPGRGEDNGDAVPLQSGEERVFHLRHDGSRITFLRGEAGAPRVTRQTPGGELTLDSFLHHRRLRRAAALPGGADLSQHAAPPISGTDAGYSGSGGNATGLTVNNSGTPARWLAPDRGEPIPVIVDATVLPPGIDEAEWRTALGNAFAAWTAASGVTFQIEAVQDFGQSPDLITVEDEKIRIQLHDTWGAVNGSGVVGFGGRMWNSVHGEFNVTGGAGGQVAGVEFHKAVRGHVIIDHTAPLMQNPKSLEEVLCHELGHVLGLNHSSNTASEPDAVKREAIMFFLAHADGRGAQLGTYDGPMIRKAHPLVLPPPWGSTRYLAAVTHASIPAGVNQVTLTSTQLGTPPAGGFVYSTTLSTTNSGSWSPQLTQSPPRLNYIPSGVHSSAAVDPATSFYDRIFYRISNGVNCSPWYSTIVYAFRRDTRPTAASDGIPDAWMTGWFGSADPAAGTNRGATQDADRDGLTNLEEYHLGTNPLSGSSLFHLTSTATQLTWPARPWTSYLLEGSDNLQSWRPLRSITTSGTFNTSYVPTPASGSTPWVFGLPSQPRFLRLRQLR
jgi:hypothetical protein